MKLRTTSLDVDRALDEARWGRFHTVTVLLCAVVTLIDGFDTQAIAYVAPVLAKNWGYGAPAFGPIFASGLFGMMV